MKRLFVIAVIALVPWSLLAAEDPGRGDSNILFTLTVTEVVAGGESTQRSARVLALDGTRASLLTGWRFPIPTQTFDPAAGAEGALSLTSYSYQDVGVEISLEGKSTGDGRFRVRGRIEISALDEAVLAGGGPDAPKVAAFSQQLDVMLRDGVETTLAQVPRPAGGSMKVTISATGQE